MKLNTLAFLAVTTSGLLFLVSPELSAQGHGHGGGGGGGNSTSAYSVVGLSGMSRAHVLTELDGATVTVIGEYAEAGKGSAIIATVNINTEDVTLLPLPEPTDDTPQDLGSTALDINSSLTVVGSAYAYGTDPNSPVRLPIRWVPTANGYVYEILPLVENDDRGWVGGVNSQGVMVGLSNLGGVSISGSRAALWSADGSQVIDLNTLLPAGSPWTLVSADDINDGGFIVGNGLLSGGRRAYFFDLTTSQVSAVPLPSGATENRCFRLNDSGQTVGVAEGPSLPENGWGFIADAQTAVYLPTDRSGAPFAYSLNNSADLIGVQTDADASQQIGSYEPPYMALWQLGSDGEYGVAELESQIPSKPVWHLDYAFGINDEGIVCGEGRNVVKGKTYWSAVLLVPHN